MFDDKKAQFQKEGEHLQKPTPLSDNSRVSQVILGTNSHSSKGRNLVALTSTGSPVYDVFQMFTNLSLIKKINLLSFSVRLPCSVDTLHAAGIDYATVTQGSTAYYCFVDGFEWINENVSDVYFTIDVWHTANDWYHVTSMFVERSGISDHSVPHQFNLANSNDVPVSFDFNLSVATDFGVSFVPQILARAFNPANPVTSQANGNTFIGELFTSASSYMSAIQDITNQPLTADTIGVSGSYDLGESYVVPAFMSSGKDSTSPITEIAEAPFDTTNTGVYRLNLPPFNSLVVCGDGVNIVYEVPDLIDLDGTATNLSLKMYACAYPPSITIVPLRSSGFENWTKAITFSNFPMVSLSKNTVNTNSWGHAITNVVGQGVSGATAGAIFGGTTGTIMLPGVGSATGAVAGGIGGALVGMVSATFNMVGDQLFSKKNVSPSPDAGGLLWRSGKGIQIFRHEIPIHLVPYLASYYKMYGYSVNLPINTFSFSDNLYNGYNYIKGTPLMSGRPSMFYETFCAQCKSGVHCWSDPGSVGNFPT